MMLAVASLPHRSKTTLAGTATLSQALLIQPGRALEAELQVRASFRESLQLHMQLRVAQKSSIPSSATCCTGAVGSAIIRRIIVIQQVGVPKRCVTRAPSMPPVANPII